LSESLPSDPQPVVSGEHVHEPAGGASSGVQSFAKAEHERLIFMRVADEDIVSKLFHVARFSPILLRLKPPGPSGRDGADHIRNLLETIYPDRLDAHALEDLAVIGIRLSQSRMDGVL
jgi:hypothetical protein